MQRSSFLVIFYSPCFSMSIWVYVSSHEIIINIWATSLTLFAFLIKNLLNVEVVSRDLNLLTCGPFSLMCMRTSCILIFNLLWFLYMLCCQEIHTIVFVYVMLLKNSVCVVKESILWLGFKRPSTYWGWKVDAYSFASKYKQDERLERFTPA